MNQRMGPARRLRGTMAAAAMIVALSIGTAGTAAAKPYAGASIVRTSACHYTVTFTWESMGHGSDLSARVYLMGWDGSNSSVIASHDFAATGRTGYKSWDFVSTESFAYRYGGYGELVTSSGNVITKSQQTSPTIVPVSAESCA
jgi:hypothetical protein